MRQKGFTLLEAMIVMVIIAIMASLTLTTYQKFSAHNELKQTSTHLYMELSNLNQVAHQYDARVFVKFFAARCSIFVDTNNNGTIDANDIRKSIEFPATISMGIAENGPTVTPTDLQTIVGLTGNWDSLMVVNNDAIGTTNDGCIYLRSKRLEKVTYCIGIACAKLLYLKQYKWEGETWINI